MFKPKTIEFSVWRSFTGYSPYGNVRQGLKSRSLLSFNSERLDRASGCYLLGNGHRCYSPVLMRFLSPDRLSPFGAGGFHVYGYCMAEPINQSDPTGQFAFWRWRWRQHGTSRIQSIASGNPVGAVLASGNPNRAKIDSDVRFILKPEEAGNLRTNVNRLLRDSDFRKAATVEVGTLKLDKLESNQKAWEQLQGGYPDKPNVTIQAPDQGILDAVNRGFGHVVAKPNESYMNPDGVYRSVKESAGHRLNLRIRLMLKSIRQPVAAH